MELIELKKENIVDSTEKSDKIQNKVRKKCGEVFIDEDNLLDFLCTLCENSFEEVDKFFVHVKGVHNNKQKCTTIKQEDPLGPSDDEFRDLKHEPNVQITTIDGTEVKLPEYGEETVDSVDTYSNENSNEHEDEDKGTTDEEEGNCRYNTCRRLIKTESSRDRIFESDEDEDEVKNEVKGDSNKKDPTFDINYEMETTKNDKLFVDYGLKPMCEICGKSFASLKSLKRHRKEVNCLRKLRKPIVSETDNESSSLKRHQDTKTNQNTNPFENKKDPTFDIDYEMETTKNDKLFVDYGIKPMCKICGKSFASLKGLRRHRKEVNCLKKLRKPIVSETDSKSSSVKRHRHTKTNQNTNPLEVNGDDVSSGNDKNSTKCRYCNRHLSENRKRIEHERIHTGEKPFQCQICGKCFRTKTRCTEHEKQHFEERLFKCEVCDAVFKSKGSLYTHNQKHGEKKFQCSYCEKSFYQKTTKIRHERYHTGEKPYKCTTCGKTFHTSGDLSNHKRRHLNIRPFKCEYCSSCFYTNEILRNHTVIHTGERPFVCTICNATFPRKKGLTSHEKIHSDLHKHICKTCGEGFKQYSGLQCHMRIHGITLASQFHSNKTI